MKRTLTYAVRLLDTLEYIPTRLEQKPQDLNTRSSRAHQHLSYAYRDTYFTYLKEKR